MTRDADCEIVEVGPEQWAATVGNFRDYNYQQSAGYSLEAAKRAGARCVFVLFQSGGSVVGGASIRLRKLPVLNGGIGYVPSGPLFWPRDLNFPSLGRMQSVVGALSRFLRGKGAYVVRMTLPVLYHALTEDLTERLAPLGFGAQAPGTVRSYHTCLIDVSRDLTDIRKGLKQKWRNCLNVSERHDLALTRGHGDDLFDRFDRMYVELVDRKNFSSDVTVDFMKRAQASAYERDRFHVTIAAKNGEDVAGYVGSALGDTSVYLLGATTDQGRRLNAGYILQWAEVAYAKEKGMRWYDLGGIDIDANPGVTRFKLGMNGIEVSAPGPYECLPAGYMARLIGLGESTYRWGRRLRR